MRAHPPVEVLRQLQNEMVRPQVIERNERGILEHGRAQNVLGLDEACHFQIVP
jgi:hypothetical protein